MDFTKFETVFVGKENKSLHNKKIIAAGKEIYKMGFAPELEEGFAGNISIREGDSFLITATCSNLGKLKEEDIVKVEKVDAEKNTVYAKGSKKPSSEAIMHYMIYKRRKEVNAIIHGHCGKFLENAARLGWKETGRFCIEGSIELADEVSAALSSENFAILKGHGFVAVGKSLEECLGCIIKRKKEMNV